MKTTVILTAGAILILTTVACGGMDPAMDHIAEDQAALGVVREGAPLPKMSGGGAAAAPAKCVITVTPNTSSTYYRTTDNHADGEYAVRARVQLTTNHRSCKLSLSKTAPDSNMLGQFHDFSYAQLYEKHKGGITAWKAAGNIDGAYENAQYIGTYSVYDTFYPQPGSASVYIGQYIHCECEGSGIAPSAIYLDWTINKSN